MKHTIKLLTLAFMLATILTLTGCPGPVNTVVPCTHENKKTVIETAATCTETGLEKIICADCGELIEEKEIAIDPDNHNFGDEWKITENPTCTEKGSKTRKCSRCGETETVEIDALGHDWEEITTDKTKAATCTEDGIAVYKCKTCGAIEERTVSKLEHDYQGGYCEREGCGKYEFENYHYTIKVFTSESAFNNVCGNQANTNALTTLCSTEPKEVKFSFNEPTTKISLNSLLHLKNDYLGYKVKKFGINGNSFDYTDSNKEVTLTIFLSALLIEPITNE